MNDTEPQPLVSLPSWQAALEQLAYRCAEYVREGIRSDDDLAREIDELHCELLSYPKGAPRCR